jgi:hypothetical protein
MIFRMTRSFHDRIPGCGGHSGRKASPISWVTITGTSADPTMLRHGEP